MPGDAIISAEPPTIYDSERFLFLLCTNFMPGLGLGVEPKYYYWALNLTFLAVLSAWPFNWFFRVRVRFYIPVI